MMAFICLLYFDQKSGGINPTTKLVVVGSFASLLIINLVLEVAILAKELTSSCCKKKDQKARLNQIEPLSNLVEIDQARENDICSEFPLEMDRNRIELIEDDRPISEAGKKGIIGLGLESEKLSNRKNKEGSKAEELNQGKTKLLEKGSNKSSSLKERKFMRVEANRDPEGWNETLD